MHICMLSWEYPPRIIGGISRHVEEISEALVAQGHRVSVITADHPGTAPYEERRGVHIYRVPNDHAPTPDFLTWVLHLNFGMIELALQVHKENPFSLIHGHDWLVGQAGILLKKTLDLPLVGTVHATENGRMQGIHTPIQRYIHQQEWALTFESWRTIVCSDYMFRELQGLFQVPQDKMDIIPNGIDYQKFDFSFEAKPFRRRYALDYEKIILFVGRMVPEKGAQVIIEAAPDVLKEYPDAKFVLVGRGGFLDELKRRANELSVAHKIHFTGYVDDDTLLRLYKVASVFTAPSLYEPFGIVALEGMGAQVPVVVSDTGGLGEIVEHKRSGLTVFPGDPKSLAWGLLEVLKDPDTAALMQDQAFQRILDTFNWPMIARQTAEVYARVLQEADKASPALTR
ncbi:MAG TPA: hypothetical protein DD435_01570 [Cyanobacteria bacterium UBA8530]|nr:hypothetical protein [Cyanobacteria bacterium UBA8530]